MINYHRHYITMSLPISDLFRRFENIIRIGTIADIDINSKRARVNSGKLKTNWLPWPANIGNNFLHWKPLRIGTQVVLACLSGDPAQAVIITTLYSQQIDAPNHEPHCDVIQFNDGTCINYNSITHHLQLTVAGSMTIHCQDDFIVTAQNVRLN